MAFLTAGVVGRTGMVSTAIPVKKEWAAWFDGGHASRCLAALHAVSDIISEFVIEVLSTQSAERQTKKKGKRRKEVTSSHKKSHLAISPHSTCRRVFRVLEAVHGNVALKYW